MCDKTINLEGFITTLHFIQIQHTKYVCQKRKKEKRTNLEGFIQEFDFGCTGVLVSPVNSYDKLDPVSMLESEISNLNKDNHNMIICKGISIFLNMNLINDLIT